ncbi:23S rRNA (adenine(2503)-C(2))-methyltransferase RlmN [Sporomusa acidovorans]|uniref:Probable dual-specificity RNA methyltransferase RlmN n=1 Tax=Sporomusa acidovorans (strain ATCC 49682 / DSM 3132 / Mol) TaxID=1123286 RepID=A0ABZ3J2W5_SPOA4|nr:23S rRNA (adenine(2503)-C(2))-methyltransferase RlmN [Sporomusa acidovorans]OZC20221.1 putative dual-specificity RNA methyltransferase RlmN [Sporomusa acidovorans DSM 3132]SDD41510.1 23S rRNA (adenine2503-C2)-methyltransferase [Sporomusa acidovorans]
MTTELFGLFASEITELTKPLGFQSYRGKQIAEWLYKHIVHSFDSMTNLTKAQRKKLAENFSMLQVSRKAVQHSIDGKTSKFLLSYPDNMAVETVLMRQPYGNSVCVSTQVGCAMGCIFCASTLGGLLRNLSGGEILAQVLFISEILNREEQKVDSLVIMGSGEPLANYNNVLRFIRLIHEAYCLNLSYRHITLSTSGIVPEIDRLAGEKLPITLSISLHAPNNILRTKLMPINRRYPIEEVIAASDRYAAATGRRITYEYSLIAEVNDQPEHARELSTLLKGKLANVNLIPINPVAERGLLRPSLENIGKFEQLLKNEHINVTVRREMGADIAAACGQLRYKVCRNDG